MPQPVKTPPAEPGRGTAAFAIGDLTVVLKEPKPGQLAVLRRISHLLDSKDKAAQSQGAGLFLDVADTLVADNAMLDAIYEGMATEKLELSDYADGLIKALKHYLPDDDSDGETPAIKSTRTRSTRAHATTRRRS